MKTVLLTAPYMLPFKNRFMPVFQHYGLDVIAPEVQERMEEEDILKYAGQFDATICGDDRYSRRVIESCIPRLKVISKWGTGIDSIDQTACLELGVQLKNTLNAFTLPVSDTVLGYILAFARRQPWMDHAMKSGEWKKIPGRSLAECTLGVVGIGNVGKAVIRRARAFGMTILGNDIAPVALDFIMENKVEMTSFKDLLSRSDFVSMNTDLNPSSRHLMNKEAFDAMKPTAVMINTSRGPVVDEKALVEALQAGKLGGAAMDVFEDEPLPMSSPLRKMENVLLAPHNSNSSPAAWERVHWNTIRNMLIGLEIPAADLDELSKTI
jgi:D-3-phosphoglycerate dehydrogenase / 2-oxoglutarate reductase